LIFEDLLNVILGTKFIIIKRFFF